MSDGDDAGAPQLRRAAFRVVRGTPSDEEVAALTVVLAAVAAAGASATSGSASRAARSRWSDPAARMRTARHPGPGAWVASAWPH